VEYFHGERGQNFPYSKTEKLNFSVYFLVSKDFLPRPEPYLTSFFQQSLLQMNSQKTPQNDYRLRKNNKLSFGKVKFFDCHKHTL
jgi:hypothetical protein